MWDKGSINCLFFLGTYENQPTFRPDRGSELFLHPLMIRVFEAPQRSHWSRRGMRSQVQTRPRLYRKASVVWNAISNEKQGDTRSAFVEVLHLIRKWSLSVCRDRSVRFFDPASTCVRAWTSVWAR